MIWIFHFIVVTLLLLITIKIKKEAFFIKASFLYAIFIFGQRWMTGTDFPYYLRYTLVNFHVKEPIYDMLQRIIMNYDLYFGLLVFLVFTLILFNYYRFIIKVDRHVILMLYLFLFAEIFFAQMSQLRQFVAISFFLNSYYYAFHKNNIKSAINILLAVGFHTSALFMVPFLFIRLKLNRIKVLYLLLLSSILPLIDVSIILNIPIFSRYSHYLGSAFDTKLSIFHYFKFYALLGVVFLFAWYIKKYKDKPMDQMILNGLVFNMLLYSISFQFGLIIRFSFYLKIFEVIFLVYFLKELQEFSLKILKPVIVTFFLGIYAGLALTDPYNITRYEFRRLRFYEDKTEKQLYYEIDTFED